MQAEGVCFPVNGLISLVATETLPEPDGVNGSELDSSPMVTGIFMDSERAERRGSVLVEDGGCGTESGTDPWETESGGGGGTDGPVSLTAESGSPVSFTTESGTDPWETESGRGVGDGAWTDCLDF
mgnify:FL=1